MVVCGQEFTQETIRRIQATVENEPGISRTTLSRRICEWVGWRRANGRWKEMSCRVALGKMQERRIITLPPAAARPPARLHQAAGADTIGTAAPIRCSLAQLGAIALITIGRGDRHASRTWNALMDTYHYLGAGPLCGAQMRYLIHSARYGWLGGLAFSAAAWSVAVRDRWIGWDTRTRTQNLDRMLCNSRFLILPWVEVPNLASHILSRGIRQVRDEWSVRYGTEPVLAETFVERDRFHGTCYRAANWVQVGMTRGRGRQDRANRSSVGVKDVYVLPLRPDWRARLCEGASPPVEERRGPPGSADWAQEEFGRAAMGDGRLDTRLVMVARDLYDRPQASIPHACQSRAKTKAAYRFFEHPETTMDKILASHYDATVTRVSQEPVVLTVQDTTSLNYSRHPKTTGLGPIGSRKEGLIGLKVHDTMAFTVDGTPLGLVDVQCWARDPKEFGKKHRRHDVPIEEKESYKWLTSFQKTAAVQKRCPHTMLVSVGDREADIYELLRMAVQDTSGPKLLVRAEQDRLLADGQGHVWEELARKPAGGIQILHVPRRGARPAREARLQVCCAAMRLKPPKRKPALGEVGVWAILAQEIDVPAGIEPLRWMLLTTVPVETFGDAVEKLAWYAMRWGIEVYHRTLKSGCKVEHRQLGSADRIESCLAIDMVVAWRIFHLTKLGRETPTVPCTVFFEEAEWKALHCYVRHNPVPPENPPTLREAMHMTASLGGFLGRTGDGEPGPKSLWLGLQRLDDLTSMWKFMAINYAPHLLSPPVSRAPTCG